jgi:quercetin dioxygenase-like cupin family protein
VRTIDQEENFVPARTLRISPVQTLIVIRSDADVFEVEAVYDGHGSRPPAHLHPSHDEDFRVLYGTLRAHIDGTDLDLDPGDTLSVRRGQVHTFWNVADEPARVHWISAPAMRCDSWFSALADMTARLQGRAADPQELAALRAAHSDTYRLAE